MKNNNDFSNTAILFQKKWNKLLNSLLRHNFIHFYWYWLHNKKKFRNLGRENVERTVPILIDGLGSIKNITKVKGTLNSVQIFFKSKYLLKEDVIRDCGGAGIIINDHWISIVFDYQEAFFIVKALKKHMADSKENLEVLDID